MTERSPVSNIQNSWFDAEQVDNSDLTLEQNYNNNVQSGFINNHVGTGALPEILVQNTLFDSNDSSFEGVLFDGKAISTLFQPSDKNFGNQLEIELSGSSVAGKRNIKIAIIGLDFQSNLQYDTFVFKKNEKQISKKHFANILLILFNDFKGPTDKSFNLGGRVVIREATPFTLSRDTLMIAQDVEPNLFFRDFFTSDGTSLSVFLAASLPLFNIDNLGISIGYRDIKILAKDDVSSQVGQKFLVKTNNIQKVSLLLSVQNTEFGHETELSWHGDLVISIFPLQSSVSCPTDLIPNLPIDFSPSNIPLAQVSINYTTLQAMGVTLDGTPQPVDFIFSNTPVARNNSIVPGNYYALTIKRSGSADQCDIIVTVGNNYVENSRVTLFTGTTWVDIPEEDLWFRIYTDAAKITDGQAYESGHGIIIPKVDESSSTGQQIDYALDKISFFGNELFTGVLSANIEKSFPVQDQRTGNPVFSRQQFVPNVKLLNPLDLSNLQAATDPLLIGVIADKNVKSFDSANSTLTASLHAWTFVKNQIVIKVIDDVTDPRYDITINSLVPNIVNGDFVNAKIIPDTNFPNIFYRIAKTEVISMIYGDINGDGIVDDSDLVRFNRLLESNLNTSPPVNSIITDGYFDGYTTTFVNGYDTYTNLFADDSGLRYELVDPSTNIIIASGENGVLVSNPNDGSLANFSDTSVDFTTINNLTTLKLIITNSTSTSGNNGGFTILGVDSSSINVINISKLYFTSDVITEIMRADITGNFNITTDDGYLLQNYIARSPFTSLAFGKIGTPFNAIRITVDPFIYSDSSSATFDRTDDFYDGVTRAISLHPIQDIFLGDGYFTSHDFLTSPITFNIVKQLFWEDYLVEYRGNTRLVPTVFSYTDGQITNLCQIEGIHYEVFPNISNFEPGTIDLFIPNNLVIGNGGELKRPNGDVYKIDFEVGGPIVIEVPDELLGSEKTINIFDVFVADYTGQGITRLGFPAMRFADCSTVSRDALELNQVRFSVSVQSFSPNLNGIDSDGYTGAIVDGKMGVSMDYTTGLLKLNFTNLYRDPVLRTLNTKVQVNVFLKKGGFNNNLIFVDSDKMRNLLNLI